MSLFSVPRGHDQQLHPVFQQKGVHGCISLTNLVRDKWHDEMALNRKPMSDDFLQVDSTRKAHHPKTIRPGEDSPMHSTLRPSVLSKVTAMVKRSQTGILVLKAFGKELRA